VSTENIQHDANDLCFWIDFINQPFHVVREFLHGMLARYLNVALASQGFKQHVQVGDAIALILVINPLALAGFRWQALPRLPNQSASQLVVTYLWSFGIIRLLVKVQHILHAGHILRARFWDAPHFLLPWLQLVFLSVRRTVSYETASTTPNCTSFPASSRRLQCACPSGASVQAVAIKVASARPSSLRF